MEKLDAEGKLPEEVPFVPAVRGAGPR